MKKITVEITFDTPYNPEYFDKVDAREIWGILAREFAYWPHVDITVQEIDADNRSTITVGDPVSGR